MSLFVRDTPDHGSDYPRDGEDPHLETKATLTTPPNTLSARKRPRNEYEGFDSPAQDFANRLQQLSRYLSELRGEWNEARRHTPLLNETKHALDWTDLSRSERIILDTLLDIVSVEEWVEEAKEAATSFHPPPHATSSWMRPYFVPKDSPSIQRHEGFSVQRDSTGDGSWSSASPKAHSHSGSEETDATTPAEPPYHSFGTLSSSLPARQNSPHPAFAPLIRPSARPPFTSRSPPDDDVPPGTFTHPKLVRSSYDPILPPSLPRYIPSFCSTPTPPVRNQEPIYLLHDRQLQARHPNDGLEKCVTELSLVEDRLISGSVSGRRLLSFVPKREMMDDAKPHFYRAILSGDILTTLASDGSDRTNLSLTIFLLKPGETIVVPGAIVGASAWWRGQICHGRHNSTGGGDWTARYDGNNSRRRARILTHFKECRIGDIPDSLRCFAAALKSSGGEDLKGTPD